MEKSMTAKKPVELPADILPEHLPRHIAIIMDGNGRWAKDKNLHRIEGHRAGAKSVRRTVESCASIGIEVLTLYAFSTENWSRPKKEVNALMKLLEQNLDAERTTVLDNNIKFRVIGERDKLSRTIRGKITKLEEESFNNSGMEFNLALSYSGRSEITRAVKNILGDFAHGKVKAKQINEELIDKYLYTVGQVDPDLLIRTSGEVRVSNFMLWQIAYSEIWLTNTKWPDFDENHLFDAIRGYQKRERRFGRIG